MMNPLKKHYGLVVAMATLGLIQSAVLVEAGPEGGEEAAEQFAAEPAVDIDTLLKAIELAIENPGELERAVRNAIDQTRQARDAKQGEIDRLQQRLDRLRQSDRLIDLLTRSSVQDHRAETSEIRTKPEPADAQREKSVKSDAAFDEEAKLSFTRRFERDIWPLILHGEKNCLACHDQQTETPLEMPGDGAVAFIKLLQEQYFDPENPDALLAKLTSPSDDSRMPPPPLARLPEEKIDIVRGFVDDLFRRRGGFDPHADERFPENLLQPFMSDDTQIAHGQDNTFLSFYQLRRKIETIFGENWTRNERDMFAKNIYLFSGADFHLRFNESTTPSATYLAGLDALASDVASNAYLNRTGPFEHWPRSLPSALTLERPDEDYRKAIGILYQRILFRDPSEKEIARTFDLIRTIHEKTEQDDGGGATLDFDLTIEGADGLSTRRGFSMEIEGGGLGLYQQTIDQNANDLRWVLRTRLGRTFHFEPGDANQSFSLSNHDTRGTMTFTGIELVGPLPEQTRIEILYDDPSARLEGAWNYKNKKGIRWIDDGNKHKGECAVEIPIDVGSAGEYELHVKWYNFGKEGASNADRALAEVFSHDPSRLIQPPLPERPPAGEAHFTIDQTDDAIAFRDLKTSFLFKDDNHYVEINNKGTNQRVVADAVKFDPVGEGETVIIDNGDAEGKDDWTVFKDFPFKPYNITGRDTLTDENKRKGELALGYKPSGREGFDTSRYWRVGVGFPGQVGNETRVPVVVRAAASSPIVRISYPRRAAVKAEVVLDASASYDIQGSQLKFLWRQVGGPKVALSDPHAARASFTVIRHTPEQAAWEGVVRALAHHPDFIFSRPVTLARGGPDRQRRNLLLVKIAQDLVGRPPTSDERLLLIKGPSLEEMIDRYLASEEFEDFYFHRIRLLIESQGTEEEDEPTRLWTYIAIHDRPFKEILTADYTVNVNMERIERPAYHGRTGLLTMKGFIRGKPGLPHFNYAAQVAEKFLGFAFEVTPEIAAQREDFTAAQTTSPDTPCYSCHKMLTPLAYQRLRWDDNGLFRAHDDQGLPIDASDRALVPTYPFPGSGMEAFALAAQNKERFIRTIIDTHFMFYFGRSMRWEEDERGLYRQLWNAVHEQNFLIKGLIKAIMTSSQYRGENPNAPMEGKLYAAP